MCNSMHGRVAILASLVLLSLTPNLNASIDSPLVSYLTFPSWLTPPDSHGHGTIGLTVVYATMPNVRVLAVKLTVLLPPGVVNATGGSSVASLFTTQMPIQYDFNVTVRSNATSPLVFKAVLTFYVYYDNKTLALTEQSNFTLPYYGTVGAEVRSGTPFVHFGFNEVPLVVINNGTSTLLNVTLDVDGQKISVNQLPPHSNFTAVFKVYVPPSDVLYLPLPVKVTYWTRYGSEGGVHKVLNLIVLENYSAVKVTYRNFLSPDPHYLVPGENYIEFNITNYLGLTVNSSWLLVLQNNSVIKAYHIKSWKPLQNVTVYLPINVSGPQNISFELYIDGKVYNLTSLWIPLINTHRLALNVSVVGNEELLEITNRLSTIVTDVTIAAPGRTVTLDAIRPGQTVTVKLNLTTGSPIMIKYKVMNVTVTEKYLVPVGEPDLSIFYYTFKTTDPQVLFLTIGVINGGRGTAYDAYLLLNLNSTSAQLNPYVVHIGTLQPGQAFYQAVSLYMGSPLPKVVVVPAQIVYNDGETLVTKNYTIVVDVYSVYQYNRNPVAVLLEYLGYSVFGVPLIFIIAIVIFIILLAIPRRRKRREG